MTAAPHSDKKPTTIFDQFSPDEQHDLRSQDSEAWNNVVAVLLLIVSVGLVLALITVLATAS